MNPEAPGSFARLLREWRSTAGLTQAELAASAGLSARGISDLERGARRAPYPHTVRQLASALHLNDDQAAALLLAARQTSTPGSLVAVAETTTLTPRLDESEQRDRLWPVASGIELAFRGRRPNVRSLTAAAVSLLAVLLVTLGFTFSARLLVPTVAPTPVATRPTATPGAGDLVIADSLADPTRALFVREESGHSDAAFSDGRSASYLWDAAYRYSALVGHVLGPYPANPDNAWLTASIGLDRPLPYDFAIQVRGRVTRSPEASAFGIGVQSGSEQMYQFEVTPADQGYRLELARGQAPVTGQSSWILPPAQINQLRLEVRGEALRALVNGHEIARAGVPQLADRQADTPNLRWAMIGPPSAGNSVEVRFAQFAVYALP